MSAPATIPTGVSAFVDDLRSRAFGFGRSPSATTPFRLGMEVEFIPVQQGSGKRITLEPLPGSERPSSLGLLRQAAADEGWFESRSPAGVPRFEGPDGALLTFEPGGQIECSSPPCETVAGVLTALSRMVDPLLRHASRAGIRLLTRGIDPSTSVEDVALQLTTDRYRRMAVHMDRSGPAGRRMMRQTAAIHLNVDFGPDPLKTWLLTNALSPYLTAIFANSPRYLDEDTGYRSFRAQQWRELDGSRSGIRYCPDDPVLGYLDFALSARAILLGPEDADARPFSTWVRDSRVGMDAWHAHLSTLFPEVRPRGYLELRGLDALPPRWYAAPIVLVTALVVDEQARAAAVELLPAPSPDTLATAGRLGVRDPAIAKVAEDLVAIALEGAGRLEPGIIGGEALAVARHFVDTFTRRSRDPGDEAGA